MQEKPAQRRSGRSMLLSVFVLLALSGTLWITRTNTIRQYQQVVSSHIFNKNNNDNNTQVNAAMFPADNIISVESVHLSEDEKKDLKRLGLTMKTPVKVKSTEKGEQIIHGRFLHITDIHPDPYYKTGSKQDGFCHSGKGNAGKYGDAILGCDSPMVLMEDTIKWIEDNLKDKIDFIVWTGDNIRHDNDRRYPRTELNIFEMNQQVSDLMYDTFKNKKDPNLKVDLIPSLGNNDVYPHNLFSPGPTLQTRELFKIWRNFIPASQLHVFNRGAYFFQEVIPNQLAILSINTLYLFQSNPLVDNCDKKKEPGYKLFEWLGYVLKEMRSRNMKVWLTGHVPPNEKNYDISCLRKYIVWSYEYRDVIIGGLYGHMNMDHFIPLDSVAAYKSIRKSLKGKASSKDVEDELVQKFLVDNLDSDSDSDSDDEDDITEPLEDSNMYRVLDENHDEDFVRVQGGIPSGKVKYMETLRESLYATIKGKRKSGTSSERYSLAFVSASVVPTFNPGLRVWEYNITDLGEKLTKKTQFEPWDSFFTGLETMMQSFEKYDIEDEDDTFKINENDDLATIFKKKRDKTFPLPKPEKLPLGPGYVPQTFTPERYVQYFADLEGINSGKKDFSYEFEYSTDNEIYELGTLVVDEWIKLGRKLGKPIKDKKKEEEDDEGGKKKKKKKKNKKKKDGKSKKSKNKSASDNAEDVLQKIWNTYLKHTFISSNYENKGFG
ncbi:hypothetical protein G9P44_002505 [Scheffersomyces stipitis]|nr:hypothetical protein G9P44_002505 [Scheffersomyces stipitis]